MKKEVRTSQLRATPGVFKGLANQNLRFHQALCELIDNAIAANDSDRFEINLHFIEQENDLFDVYIVDESGGMDIDTLDLALQLGEPATKKNRLNEHGFGLKNSLTTLSKGTGKWEIYTKENGSSDFLYVEAPFNQEMPIYQVKSLPSSYPDFSKLSTVVYVQVPLSFMQTVQRGKGRRATKIDTIIWWIYEHIGVLYRGYLDLDIDKMSTSGIIKIHFSTVDKVSQTHLVRPILAPIAMPREKTFNIDLSGVSYELKYVYGTLNTESTKTLIEKTRATKYYYQGNEITQGIDIRLGKRVISTSEFDSIWPYARHGSFNDFIGELLIPELPRGVLTTTNNKTDFNFQDSDWNSIFEYLEENFEPERNPTKKTEKQIRSDWKKTLEYANPEDKLIQHYKVWSGAAEIDLFHEKESGVVQIYEIKVGDGQARDLYQLMMYWDGLVLEDVHPTKGFLFAAGFTDVVREMSNIINSKLKDPVMPPKI